VTFVSMELIAQIALGVIIGGLTIALVVIGFFVWNSRQKNERLAVGLFIAAAVIIAVLVALHGPVLALLTATTSKSSSSSSLELRSFMLG